MTSVSGIKLYNETAYMKIFSFVILCLVLFSACSKAPKDEILKDIYKLGEAKTSSEAEAFYTKRTVELSRKSDAVSDILLSFERKIFVKGSEYEVKDKKISGSDAVIVLRIIKNPSMNLIGLELEIPFKYEDGKWKIDRSEDIVPISR